MSKRALISLLAIVGLLCAAAIARRMAAKLPEHRAEEAQPLQIDFSTQTADRLVISKGAGNERVELRRADGAWRVSSSWNAKADAGKIEQWLSSLLALKGEMRGDSDALLSDFGITDEHALHVEVFQGPSSLLHLLIGDAQAGWQQLFVRKAGSSAVFLAQSSLLSEIGIFGKVSEAALNAETWLDLRFMAFAPEQIEQVELKEQSADRRMLGNKLPFESDAGAMQAYLKELLNLKAHSLADPAGKDYGFDEPQWQLRLVGSSGPLIELTVGAPAPEASAGRYIRVDGDAQVYVAPNHVLEQIRVDESRFIIQDPLHIEGNARQALTVSVPGKTMSVRLSGAHWPGLEEYLQGLRAFRPSQVNNLPARAAGALKTPHRIEVSGAQPEDLVSVACERPENESTDQILCRSEQRNQMFLINRATFQALFEHLERLEQPQPAAA